MTSEEYKPKKQKNNGFERKYWLPRFLDICTSIYDSCKTIDSVCRDIDRKTDYIIKQARDIDFALKVFEDIKSYGYKDRDEYSLDNGNGNGNGG